MSSDLFRGTRPPRAPADLRERVLLAARAAAREASAAARPWWGFTRLDLAWAAGLLALVLCHALLSLSKGPSPATPASSAAIAQQRQLERELGLPRAGVVVAGRNAGTNGEAQRQLVEELERL
jgi:hypothetical protein